ncbi:hypothetical protein BC826DRAFT_1161951 [Russula brevipes]|nr:hypothetical protein BC826DRAFT_1161951 [Russula brevipes]
MVRSFEYRLPQFKSLFGVEDQLEGVVDPVSWEAIYSKGTRVAESDEIPTRTLELAAQKRTELIEQLAKVDDEIAELLLNGTPVQGTTRCHDPACNRLTHILTGSAIKYMAVQTLLDNVRAFLGSPAEREVVAHDPVSAPQVELIPASAAPLAALAFKLQEGPFGKLAYMRVYQGTLKEGQFIFHGRSGKSIKVPKLVRIHGSDMETSMLVPGPLISLAIQPISTETPKFSRALNQVQNEDRTGYTLTTEARRLRSTRQKQSERSLRTRIRSRPAAVRASMHWYMELMEMGQDGEPGKDFVFESVAMDGNVPSNYIPERGSMRHVPRGSFLEPIMTVEVVASVEFRRAVIGGLDLRRGTIINSKVLKDEFTAVVEVSLNDMFGYSSQLRPWGDTGQR